MSAIIPVQIEIPTGNFLRPNGHGGYIIRQSDLSSWWRCNLQKWYEDRARNDPDAPQPKALSATEYGSVIHYAVMVMEQLMHEAAALPEGSERDDAMADALRRAQATFEFYWNPENIRGLEGVTWPDEWLPRESFGGLRERGRHTLRDHHAILLTEKSSLIALEYQFAVPMLLNGRLHTFTGTVDRISIRQHYKKPYVGIDDNKSGKQATFLRYNTQGSAYSWASTQPTFWTGWDESGYATETFDTEDMDRLHTLFSSYGYQLHNESPGEKIAARRFRWINLKELKWADGGWRVPADYGRFFLAVESYVRGCENEAYGVNTVGEICRYCAFKSMCGGGLPDPTSGAPDQRVNSL